MEEKKKVPAVRFKGFTGDWERRKLGEVFKEYSEKNHPELPPLTIVQGKGTVLREDSERALQYDKSSLPSYKLVNKGDFIVHLRSFEGGLEKATTQGIISPAYHTFHGEGTDSRFYYAYFRSQKFINHDLFPYVYGIRDGRSIDIDGMKKIRLPFPSYAEQKKIGDFIDTIDGYSILHQQKLDQLKKLKAYFLQNLFPAKGEKVPKFRFKGFTEEWERRKLGEITAEFKSGKGIKADAIEEHGTYPVYGGNGLRGYTEQYNHDGEYALIGRQGALCGNMNYSIGRAYFTEHAVAVKANDNNNTKFLYYLLGKMNLGQYSDQSAQPGLAVNKLIALQALVPSKQEQFKISSNLGEIDNIITLHQQKITHLQAVKKFLLQNLFV